MSMTHPSYDPESQADHSIEDAIGLLSQQLWCWGCDILRPEGNWLLVDLGAPAPNTRAIGAVIEVEAGGKLHELRESEVARQREER